MPYKYWTRPTKEIRVRALIQECDIHRDHEYDVSGIAYTSEGDETSPLIAYEVIDSVGYPWILFVGEFEEIK